MKIPAELRIKVDLRQGSIYYYSDDGLTSTEPHYFIVLNESPKADRVLFLVCATSQVERCRKRAEHLQRPTSTLVLTGASECSCFSRDTVFDCNSVFERSIQQLVEKLETKQLRLHGAVPDLLRDRLVAGVLASPLVSREIKTLISKT